MTHTSYAAPWHRASYDHFTHERLPALLASRLPLTGYHIEDDEYACRVTVRLGDAEATYSLPRPDVDGLFHLTPHPWVVVPLASSEYLETAVIACVGEQIASVVEARLGEITAELPWDETLIRAVLPLEDWILDVISPSRQSGQSLRASGQWLDHINWLSTQTHLRRIVVPEREHVITARQFGRVCPFESPEGPNIGHVFSLATGAAICDGRIIIKDDTPEAALGLTAAMVPFLEHNDPNRQIFGVNMLRQWIPPMAPEPALVQSGREPAVPDFWCGYNLLTAFVSWGADTYEDAILISESCARRMRYATPVEPGDKFSNRHGSKGVISRIVPDKEMPRLSDGTPVELVYNYIALHARLNFGQAREAVMSRIALATGQPAIVPPFHAPSIAELQQQLTDAGLPVDGMETLTWLGEPLARRSLVGWIYWGRTRHLAEEKIHVAITPEANCLVQGELEFYALRDSGAIENLRETYNTRAAERPDAGTLAQRVAAGPITQADPPTPRWQEIEQRLAAAGIRTELADGRLTFAWAPPAGAILQLATPIPHPWLREQMLSVIGVGDGLPDQTTIVHANTRLARLLHDQAPKGLAQQAQCELEMRVNEWFEELLTPRADFMPHNRTSLLRPSARVLFSARTVLAPAVDLRIDQLGLADEIAWTLFGPLAAREVGEENVNTRSQRATQALDAVMTRSWVILTRAPVFMQSAQLAFHPVRTPDRVIRLHPLACMLMNADFDGDQAGLLLLLTEAAQREAGERLSITGQLRRDPSLVQWLFPNQESLWGLAMLSLTAEGRAELAALAGTDLVDIEGYVTRDSLTRFLRDRLQQEGEEAMLDLAQRLMARGFAVTQHSGASINPFIGSELQRPTTPTDCSSTTWNAYTEEVSERLAACNDFMDHSMGAQLLAIKSGARGSLHQLQALIGPWGVATDVNGNEMPIRHGWSDGLTADELFAVIPSAREGLYSIAHKTTPIGYGVRKTAMTKAFTVLARAMRADHPGYVFAHAAANGEIDPLTDGDSRLFVGI